MILIDFNNVVIGSIMTSIKMHENGEINIDLIRHFVLNSLRMYRKKFHANYGELILCADGFNSWRRDVFPAYKASRKTDQGKSTVDWKELYKCFNQVTDEIREIFPYKYIRVDRAEGDDVIGTLVQRHHVHHKIMIVSSDKDFLQLQKYKGVKQFSPRTKKMLKTEGSPELYLKQHILSGDVGDGIPNFLSSATTFVDGGRQTPMKKTKLERWSKQDPADFCTLEQLERFKQNQVLIDLNNTPSEIQIEIINNYNIDAPGKRSKILNYLIKNKLNNLIDCLGEF